MKHKWRNLLFLIICVLVACSIDTTTVLAGQRRIASSFVKKESLNTTDWNFTDNKIVCQDGKVLIPAETSSQYTKVISKTIMEKSDNVKELVTVSSELRFTQLPEGKKVILAFGLSSIEANSEQEGNLELIFTNEGGVKMEIIAYTNNGPVVVMDKKACGVSVNSKFTFQATILSEGLLNVDINKRNICKKEIPLSGEGRFGILQTGSCGAEISEMSLNVYLYDTPENVNIDEDFESGEWNANVLIGQMANSNGLYNSNMSIEDYNGSKVLMFRNAGSSWFGTRMKYSNFELSFDIPFFQRSSVYDEEGNLIMKASEPLGLGFGEENEKPVGEDYSTDSDFLLLSCSNAQSWMRKAFHVKYEDLGLANLAGKKEDNTGYSVKFTVVDGSAVLQVKPLNAQKYQTVVTCEYETFREGYIKIWATPTGHFAIDNFKVTNLDENPNLIEPEYKSSVLIVNDYERTEEETKLVFSEDEAESEEKKIDYNLVILGGCSIATVILIVIGIIIRQVSKRRIKQQKGA